MHVSTRIRLISCLAMVVAALLSQIAPVEAQAPAQKPNIVVIFGDDIGMWNVGAYTHGMMGRTPSIDRIAAEGMLFTDHYGQPSCTAGRAAFIMGQLPIRTGMTTIGIPGSTRGIPKSDPTLAEVLKSQGYATAQFGKNHLGDRNEFLPTVHGFDEWFGNLYHLNAEEEPEELDYPGQKNPAYKQKFGPRGVLHTWATDADDATTRSEIRPRRQAEDPGHRRAHSQAHGDVRRGGHRRDLEVAGRQWQGRQAVLRLVQHDRDPRVVASQPQVPPAGGE